MLHIKAYHRPKTIKNVLELLSRAGVSSILVAGGTYINAHMDKSIQEVIDLQAVPLAQLAYKQNQITLGAMTRLQTIVDDSRIPPLLREMAHREGPNTFRNAATIGGVVVGADWESELLAALLLFEAKLTIHTLKEVKTITLSDFLSDVSANLDGGLITEISFISTGKTASERVARTPADRPIVAALARLDDKAQPHLALCGVAPTPILVAPEQLESLAPPADFRGSSDYRRKMASVLTNRVLKTLKTL